MIYGPKKNAAFTVYLPLVTRGEADWKDAPTIAAGDFQVKKDAGGFANLATLPALDAAGEKVVKVTLSAGEMNADVVVVRAIDQTNPKEWEDSGIVIVTTPNGVGLQSGDGYARLGAPAGASIAADVAAVKGDTGAIKPKTDTIPVAGPASAADYTAARAAKLDAVSEARLAELDAANVPADAAAAAAAAAAVDGRLPEDPADQSLLIAATDAIMNRIGVPAGASLSADLAAVKTVADWLRKVQRGRKYPVGVGAPAVVHLHVVDPDLADDGLEPTVAGTLLLDQVVRDKDGNPVVLQGTGIAKVLASAV